MTNDQAPMTNEEGREKPRFDLGERTAKFGESVIEFVMTVPRNAVTSPIISQLIRSATSVGLNYCEADEAVTRKEFKYRIGVCKREARETKLSLRFLVKAAPDKRERARSLWKEIDELNRIFASIYRTAEDND